MSRTPPPEQDRTTPDADTPPTGSGADEDRSRRPGGEHAFFAHVRRLGLARRRGWIGGVCAGVGDALGLDPILVRGIAVVIAVLGGPVVLLYAVAWLLLPDTEGTIHAQQLGRGRVTWALAGIGGLVLLSFLPLTQGFWYAGALYWGEPNLLGSFGRIAWTAVVLVLAVLLVVWLARRASSGTVTEVPATTDDRPETVPMTTDGAVPDETAVAVAADTAEPSTEPADTAAAPSTEPADTADTASAVLAADATPSVVAEPAEPPAPPTDANPGDLAEWKASQAVWREQRALWAEQRKKEERERWRVDVERRAAEAAERRRIRRLTRPRASAAVVAVVLGAALAAGAIVAFAAAAHPYAWVLGAATTATVLGLAAMGVGIARRRSGALAFFAGLAALVTLVGAVLPVDRTLAPFGGISITPGDDQRWAVLAGGTTIDADARRPGVVDLWQATGYVDLRVAPDTTVRVIAVGGTAPVDYYAHDDEGGLHGILPSEGVNDAGEQLHDVTVGEGDPDVTVRLWLGGDAVIQIRPWGWVPPSTTPALEDPAGEYATPSPTPQPTRGASE